MSRDSGREPGRKPREYPHSSGDRNTYPPRKHPDKETFEGGRQHVAPPGGSTDGHAGSGGASRRRS